MINRNFYLISILLSILGMSIVEILSMIKGEGSSDTTKTLWDLFFVLGSILWTLDDVKTRKYTKPFDFGFFIYIFWPVAFPYYLIQTRGIKGVGLLFIFIFLYLLPFLFRELAYSYLYGE